MIYREKPFQHSPPLFRDCDRWVTSALRKDNAKKALHDTQHSCKPLRAIDSADPHGSHEYSPGFHQEIGALYIPE